jgi:hypothetical protein
MRLASSTVIRLAHFQDFILGQLPMVLHWQQQILKEIFKSFDH